MVKMYVRVDGQTVGTREAETATDAFHLAYLAGMETDKELGPNTDGYVIVEVGAGRPAFDKEGNE